MSSDVTWPERAPLGVPMLAIALGVLGMTQSARLLAQSLLHSPRPEPAATTAPSPSTPRAIPAPVSTAATALSPADPAGAAPVREPVVCPELPRPYFAPGSAALDAGDASALQRLGTWLAAHPDVTVAIDGYADRVGSATGNLVMSDRRAQAVAGALAAGGVPESRMVLRALGARAARDEAGTDSTERRAELTLQNVRCALAEVAP